MSAMNVPGWIPAAAQATLRKGHHHDLFVLHRHLDADA